MAEIPVQRKGGVPGWAWALGALAVVAAIILIAVFTGNGERGRAAMTDRERAGQEQGQGGTQGAGGQQDETGRLGAVRGGGEVTRMEVAQVLAVQDPSTLFGKQVQMVGVQAQRVVSDRIFAVGPDQERVVYVMLAPELDRGAAEQRIVVKAGDRLDLTGTIEDAAEDRMRAAASRELSAQETAGVRGQRVYLLARQIRGASGNGSGQTGQTGQGQPAQTGQGEGAK